jgi:AcrR family transcriptional regulator
MARTAKADYRALMTDAARRRLENGEEVAVTSIAAELDVSPGLVHFYFGDRQSLLNAAWQQILMAHVDDDLASVRTFAEQANWMGVHELTDRVFSADRDDIHLAHLRASVESMHDHELSRIFDEATEVTITHWAEQVRLAMENGVARTSLDPRAIGVLIMAVPLGVAVTRPRLSPDERTAVSEAWATMLRAVLQPGFSMEADHAAASENPGRSRAQCA